MNKGIRSLLIYTTGDYPYGMAPENLVRQMALGLKYNNVRLKVIRLRGQSYDFNNDTGIEARNFFMGRLPKTEIAKIFELITFILFIPISVLRNKIKLNPEAIILYGVEYFYLIFPFWIASKILGIKLIRITTDFYKESSIVPVWWKKPKVFFYMFQFKHFDKCLDGIVSLSRYMAEFAEQSGVQKEKILIIHHFINVEGFCLGITSKGQTEITRIGFCGTPTEANGIYDLIEAFKLIHAKYPDSELLIIGEPPPSEKLMIMQLISTCGDSVKISGFLSRGEVPAALLTCNILVNPRKSGVSAEAGFPTKLGEYFSCRIPVVATCVGDIRNYFTDKQELVIVNPDHPAEIADAVTYLINNPKESERIGLKGFQWAKNNLDYKVNAARLLEFIQSV